MSRPSVIPGVPFFTLLLLMSNLGSAEETYVTIQKVSGNRMLIVKDQPRGGGGMRGANMTNGMANGEPTPNRRNRGGRTSTASAFTISVPRTTKITSAMRERRTFEFRVLNELPGGLKHHVFQTMQKPLQARIMTNGSTLTEINVITGESDINQSGSDSMGQAVIAVRPKRPPMK